MISLVENRDCMEAMREFPDKFFDVCITDFPYGVDIEYGSFNDTKEGTIALINNAMPEILRVSKRSIITSGTKLMYYYPRPDWVGCIYSSAGVGVCSHGFACWQPILIYGKDPKLSINKGSHPDSITYNGGNDQESKFHPVPKPLKLWKQVFSRWTNEKDQKIIDPFLGSGTSRIIADQMGFDFWGYELDKEYFDASCKRFDQYKAQLTIFT